MSETPGAPRAPLSTTKALAYSFTQRYLAFIVQLGPATILARLLTPRRTGIYSLAMAAVALGSVLIQCGATDFVLSQKELSQNRI